MKRKCTLFIAALFALLALPAFAHDSFLPLGDIAKKKQTQRAARVYTNDDFPEVVEVAAPAEPAPPATAPTEVAKAPAPLPVACSTLAELKEDRARLRKKAQRLSGYLDKAEGEMQKQIYNNGLKRVEEELVIAEMELRDLRENEDVSACEQDEEPEEEADGEAAPAGE